MAHLILDGDASREEWLQRRHEGVTASEIAVIMGLAPSAWGSPLALYLTKRGDIPEEELTSEPVMLGHYLEEYVCERFAERYPEYFQLGNGQHLYSHPDYPWRLATPDRVLTESEDGEPVAVLEAKTSASYEDWGEEGTDEIPVRYRSQVIWQMHVLELELAYVACLFMSSRKTKVYTVRMNAAANADLELMTKSAEDFLDMVASGTPPDIDWRDATRDALKKLHPDLEDYEIVIPVKLASQYSNAVTAERRAILRRKQAENEIRARLGNGRVVTDFEGNVIAMRQRYDVPARITEHKAFSVDKLVPRRERES